MTSQQKQKPKRRSQPPAWLTVRYAAEYGVLRTAIALLRVMGIDRASRVNGALWRRFAPYTRRHAAALRHLQIAFPDLGEREREKIARDVWENLGRTAAEALMIDTFASEPWRVRLTSPEVVQAVRERAGGRAVIAPIHSGNWEVFAPALTEHRLSGALIYQRVKNPYGERFLRRTREKYCPGGMYPKNENAVRRLVSWLRAGNAVVILSDQRAHGAMPLFFGHPAPSTPLPAYMARSFDAPLVAARVVRTSGANFDLEFKEIPVPRTDDRDADIAAATQALQAVYEDWITEHPGQWMWAHRRWSHAGPPEGWSPDGQKKTRGPKAARRKTPAS